MTEQEVRRLAKQLEVAAENLQALAIKAEILFDECDKSWVGDVEAEDFAFCACDDDGEVTELLELMQKLGIIKSYEIGYQPED